ncbi:MAG: WD40/YVTN/BNR-like repeat-containing protein [Stackebrandtia sp.]
MSYLMAIGTQKGLFTAVSTDRKSWEVTGPHRIDPVGFLSIAEIYAVGISPHTKRILVGAGSSHYGPSVWHSDDLGNTWHEPEAAPIAFPQDLPYRKMGYPGEAQYDDPDSDEGNALTRVWQLAFGPDANRVYAGTEPTALFVSDDEGLSFTLNRALWNHPTRDTWASGGGGPAIHTVVPDPSDADSVTIAMSTGGVYQTEDGGRSWEAVSKGIQFDPDAPDPYPASGQCVHKVTRDGAGVFYAQNHGGVYRSDEPRKGWTAVDEGLPSDFGFAMVGHPHRAGTALQFPVVSGERRFPPDERLQVQRTDDGGKTWRSVSAGLPENPYYGIVLRDAANTDFADDPGFYFGTRTGDVFASTDSGERWHQVAANLPDVLCVRAAEV